MKKILTGEPTSLSIFVNFMLLVVAIFAYVFVDKYLTATANEKIDLIEEKSEGNLSEKDAINIATEKYYIAEATITNTKADIDKLYDQLKVNDVTLTDESLITGLNNLGGKTFTTDMTAQAINNYSEAITDNFTENFINNHIMYPNGFIGKLNEDYYIIRDKTDNYRFKEVEIKLVSMEENLMTFTATNTNYAPSCLNADSAAPKATCTSTELGEERTFKLVKEDKKWKISEMAVKSS